MKTLCIVLAAALLGSCNASAQLTNRAISALPRATNLSDDDLLLVQRNVGATNEKTYSVRVDLYRNQIGALASGITNGNANQFVASGGQLHIKPGVTLTNPVVTASGVEAGAELVSSDSLGTAIWRTASVIDITRPPYSADTNGLVDASAAFKSALRSGREIYVPAGIYTVTNLALGPLTNVIIRGQGTLRSPSTNIIYEWIYWANCSNVVVEGLTFDGNYASNTCLVTHYSSDLTYNRCKWVNHTNQLGTLFTTLFRSDCDGTLTDCAFINTLGGSNEVGIARSVMFSNTDNTNKALGRVRITRTVFDGLGPRSDGDAIYLEANNKWSDAVIEGCTFSRVAKRFVKINTDGVIVRNNYGLVNRAAGYQLTAVGIYGSHNQVINNTFVSTNADYLLNYGFQISEGNNQVVGNIVSNSLAAVSEYGVWLQDSIYGDVGSAANNQIIGNTFYNSYYGVWSIWPITNLMVAGNSFFGMLGNVVHLAHTNYGVRITDNYGEAGGLFLDGSNNTTGLVLAGNISRATNGFVNTAALTPTNNLVLNNLHFDLEISKRVTAADLTLTSNEIYGVTTTVSNTYRAQIPVTPQHYGAVVNDDTDDTAAVNSAIASGRHVYFPAGIYMVTNIVKSSLTNVVLSGPGEIRSPTGNVVYEWISWNSCSNVVVDGLTFNHNYCAINIGLGHSAARQMQYRNCRFVNHTNTITTLNTLYFRVNCHDATIDNCRFERTSSASVARFIGVENTSDTNSYSARMKITRCHFDTLLPAAKADAILISQAGYFTGGIISGCTFNRIASRFMRIVTDGVVISGNHGTVNQNAGLQLTCVALYGSQNRVVDNTFVSTNAAQAVNYAFDVYRGGNTIAGNILSNAALVDSTYGLYMDYPMVDLVVKDNRFSNFKFGSYSAQGSTNMQFIRNIFRGENGQTVLNFIGENQNLVVEGNWADASTNWFMWSSNATMTVVDNVANGARGFCNDALLALPGVTMQRNSNLGAPLDDLVLWTGTNAMRFTITNSVAPVAPGSVASWLPVKVNGTNFYLPLYQ